MDKMVTMRTSNNIDTEVRVKVTGIKVKVVDKFIYL